LSATSACEEVSLWSRHRAASIFEEIRQYHHRGQQYDGPSRNPDLGSDEIEAEIGQHRKSSVEDSVMFVPSRFEEASGASASLL
jgi:hypothetical protein